MEKSIVITPNTWFHLAFRFNAVSYTHLYVAVAGTDAKVLVNLYGNAKADIEGVGIEVRQMNKNTY